MNDALADKEHIRRDWTARGPHWDRHADAIADQADMFNQLLLDAAEIGPGHAVLDLACGTGEPAISAARRVGSGGSVLATDFSPTMLAAARRRVAAAESRAIEGSGSEGGASDSGGGEASASEGSRAVEAGASEPGTIEVRFADMEELPFEDAAFERVTCRFGLMFVPNTARALGEARRVLRPGGRAAFLVWGPIEDNTIFAALRQAGIDVLGEETVKSYAAMGRLAQSDALRTPLLAAGFEVAREIELRPSRAIDASEKFWGAMLDMSFGHLLEDAGDRTRAALDDAVARNLEACRTGDQFELQSHARIGVGEVAA